MLIDETVCPHQLVLRISVSRVCHVYQPDEDHYSARHACSVNISSALKYSAGTETLSPIQSQIMASVRHYSRVLVKAIVDERVVRTKRSAALRQCGSRRSRKELAKA